MSALTGAHPGPGPRRAGPVLALAAVGAVALALLAWLRHFPVQPLLLGGGLVLAALVVAWRPLRIWWLLPAALPVLDLAPWSGRLFFDEFDALLALLLAVAWWRGPPPPHPASRDRWLAVALLAVALSVVASTLRALLPWPGLDADAFNNLLSPFNALRVARGAGWALLLWALARRQRAAGQDVASALGQGLVLGLLGTVLCVLAERAAFTQWFDVSDGYRVAGPFSAMHTGGAYVEAFLVVSLPFLLAGLRPPVAAWRLLARGALLVLAMYAVMVTFSRGGYAAFALALAVMLVLGARQRGGRTTRATQLAAGLAIVLLATTVAAPVLLGSFARSRLATVDRDLVTREQHWARTLALVDPDPAALLLGMGMGQLPAVRLLHSPPAERTASFRLVDEAGQHVLRLGSGHAVYIEQWVAARPDQIYRLRLRLRATAPGATLAVSLCEKWLVASARCASTRVGVAGDGQWSEVSATLASAQVAAPLPGLARPVKLSFYLGGAVPLDLASIQLLAPDGQPLLRNADFAAGLDHWFFTADDHLAWHAKSMPLAVFFDQGLFGLLAMAGLLLLGVVRAGRAAWLGEPAAAPLLAALLAFSTVGAIDTLLDAPRFLMLWLLLCSLAAAQRPPRPGR